MNKFAKFIPMESVVHKAVLQKDKETVWYSLPNEKEVHKLEVHKTANSQGTWEFSCGG